VTRMPDPQLSPRDAQTEMVAAVLAGAGLEGVAAVTAAHAGAPVAIVIPHLGIPVQAWARYERYVSSRWGARPQERPPEITSEASVVSGAQTVGAVLLLGEGRPDADEYLHMAAVAALTEVAVSEAREAAERSLRGSFLEDLLSGDPLDREHVLRRAQRLGCDLSAGAVAMCVEPGERPVGHVLASITAERPEAIAQLVGGRVYAVLPGDADRARQAAQRVGTRSIVGLSSWYGRPEELHRALEEAELVVDVKVAGGEPEGHDIGEGAYRLLFRVFASHPDEVERIFEATVATIVRYDDQYSTDLVGTLHTYLEQNCNMNATASAIFAHRHTVSYRLDRVRELTGLNPALSEDRERLSLGLKAYRVLKPRLPR
jgi:DNA-binding PucR family transcriptional regulator